MVKQTITQTKRPVSLALAMIGALSFFAYSMAYGESPEGKIDQSGNFPSYETIQAEKYLAKYPTLLDKIYRSSFVMLNQNFAMDEENAYYQDKIIPNADLATFEVFYTAGDQSQIYAKDKNNVYYQDRIINKADPLTFEPIGHNAAGQHYAVDHKAAYWQDKRLEGANPKTFRYHNHVKEQLGYAQDDQYVFFRDSIIKGMDGKTFHVIYIKEDTGTLQYSGYSKDQHQVYYLTQRLEKADSQTFRLLKANLAVDNKHVYIRDKIKKGLDCNTIEVLNENFLKDRHNVYYQHNSKLYKVDEADPKTFTVSDGDPDTLLGQDKNFAFELDGKGDYVVII